MSNDALNATATYLRSEADLALVTAAGAAEHVETLRAALAVAEDAVIAAKAAADDADEAATAAETAAADAESSAVAVLGTATGTAA